MNHPNREAKLVEGQPMSVQMAESDIEKARLWVVTAHTNRLKHSPLRWQRCRYEQWRKDLPAGTAADSDEESEDSGPDVNEACCGRGTGRPLSSSSRVILALRVAQNAPNVFTPSRFSFAQ